MDTITSEELSRYDRQIRLWGFDGQKRILTAKVLFIGINQLVMETAKNLVLGGVGQLSFVDDTAITEKDIDKLYLLQPSNIGEKKDTALSSALSNFNPTVSITAESQGNLLNTSFISSFNLVVVTNCNQSRQVELNEMCRSSKTMFISTDMFGLYGYIFCDLVEHHYTMESKEKSKLDPDEIVTKTQQSTELYTSLNSSISHTFESMSERKMKRLASPLYFVLQSYAKLYGKFNRSDDSEELYNSLKESVGALLDSSNVNRSFVSDEVILNFINNLHTNLTAATSILGGILAQEVIKIISGKNLPISNWLIFDALESDALIHRIG